MTTTLTPAARTASANATLGLLNVGGAGTVQYQTSAGAAIATLALSATAFATAVSGVASAAAITPANATAGGTIARAVFRNNAAAEVLRVDVTGPGGSGEIQFSSVESLTVGIGDSLALSSFTYTVPATSA